MGVREIRIDLVLQKLAARRPVFHSEADFQHEFAWECRHLHPDYGIRLELPTANVGIGTTDLVVFGPDQKIGIELKYLTKRFSLEYAGELFELKSHGATDLRRYDVLKDVQRLERFNEYYRGRSFVVTLTNDAAYWGGQDRLGTIDSYFRIHEGRNVSGTLTWSERAGRGTVKGREMPITLGSEYSLKWHDYSDFSPRNGKFRYLCIEIPSPIRIENNLVPV